MAGQEYKRHVLNTLCSSRYVKKEADILFTVDSSPIDEPGNWCHESVVRALCKYEAQQGGFHGDPMSGNQPKVTLHLSNVLGERRDHKQEREEPVHHSSQRLTQAERRNSELKTIWRRYS